MSSPGYLQFQVQLIVDCVYPYFLTRLLSADFVIVQSARRLKLKSLPQCVGLSGGRSVELVARDGDPRAFGLHHVMSRAQNCDFSFSGIKTWLHKTADREEHKYGENQKHIIDSIWS